MIEKIMHLDYILRLIVIPIVIIFFAWYKFKMYKLKNK